jgi:hypothetical protein
VLFLHNTSRVEDEPYPTLLQDKGFRGFPSLCFMDADGNVLTKPTQRTVANFGETHAQTKKLLAIRAKGDKASPAEQKELFLAELDLGLIKAEEIQPRADKLTLSAEEKARVAGKVVDLEVADIMAKSRDAGPEKTGEALVALLKAGKTPSEQNTMFWGGVLRHASTQKDAELAKRAYDVLMKRKDAPERAKEAWKKALEEAQAK